MKNWTTLFAALTMVCLVSWGCTPPEPGPGSNTSQGDHGHDHGHDHGEGGHDHDGDGHDDHASHEHSETVPVAMYCGDCGHGVAKATDHKCDDSHAACEKCGMHQGAELCCKVEGDLAGKALCASCGEVAATEACCKADAAVCEKCGLHAGAPLCCKLGAGEKAADEDHGEAASPAKS